MMLVCLCLQSDYGCKVGLTLCAANVLGDLIYICQWKYLNNLVSPW